MAKKKLISILFYDKRFNLFLYLIVWKINLLQTTGNYAKIKDIKKIQLNNSFFSSKKKNEDWIKGSQK